MTFALQHLGMGILILVGIVLFFFIAVVVALMASLSAAPTVPVNLCVWCGHPELDPDYHADGSGRCLDLRGLEDQPNDPKEDR